MNTTYMVKALHNMADELDGEAAKMRKYASQIERHQNFDAVPFALNSIGNLLNNLRLDLLVALPIREFEMAIHNEAQEAPK